MYHKNLAAKLDIPKQINNYISKNYFSQKITFFNPLLKYFVFLRPQNQKTTLNNI